MILLECAATGELPMERVGEEIGVERLRAAAAIDPAALPSIEEQQIVQAVADAHGGCTEIPPAPNTTVRLWFPAVPEPARVAY